MHGAVLSGNSTVELREYEVPQPGHGELVVRTRSSTICGSDIRALHRERVGTGPEEYQNVIAGHEPCGQVEAVGPGCRRFGAGDRVIVYRISGCGVCNDRRRGYMISCTSEKFRRAYGWERNGGMAPYILAEEMSLVLLPYELSYTDGAHVACAFGTVDKGLDTIGVCGNDAALVIGLGPVALAALMLSRAMGASTLVATVSVPRHHPRSEDDLRLVGNEYLAYGGARRTAGSPGLPSGGSGHSPVRAQSCGRSVRAHGGRQVQQGRVVFDEEIE